jgi:hypothetical protein
MAKTSSFFKKIALFFATAVVAAMLVPAVAFADVTTYGSNSGPDKVIGVTWTDANGTHTDTVYLDNMTATTTPKKGALFCKNNVWNVVGSDEYLTLESVLSEATYEIGDDEYSAFDVWGPGKSLTFTVWNNPNNTGWICENYTKYSGFSYANIAAATNFYGDTTASVLGTTVTGTYSDMIIALKCGATPLSGTTTATSALADLATSSTNAPRVMWGYLDSLNEGGNRFPSNIDSITIN